MATLSDYEGQTPAWCPGCGNFGILKTVRKTLVDLGIEPHQVTMVSGIGQAAKLPHYTRCNTFNGLHGRALPAATGIALANHRQLVIVETGDGDCYAEGGNHFVHAIRRNVNIKLFVHDNQVYGLTKGQASPTSEEGMVTKLQPFGVLTEQENPLTLAIALNCSFVARGFAGDIEFLQQLMSAAIQHRGFALLDILQPCITFNRLNTFKWYRERVYHLEQGYDPTDRDAAFARAREWGERIPIGIFYRRERPLFEERVPVIQKVPLVKQPFDFKKVGEEVKAFY
jgi:2-oxoglutarate/2-oxoacid ferredoxin oxidoreductase subunit beta